VKSITQFVSLFLWVKTPPPQKKINTYFNQ